MGVFKPFSSSSYDKVQYRDRIVEKRVEVVLPNPDPENYVIDRCIESPLGLHVVLEVTYPDCKNYEGKKIMVYEYVTLDELVEQQHLDPHFAESKRFHSPIARFEPTERGWKMATELVWNIEVEIAEEDEKTWVKDRGSIING